MNGAAGSVEARGEPALNGVSPGCRGCDTIPQMAQSKLPEDLEQRLLALDPADRLALATRLLASVEGPDPDRDEAWSAELDRRDAELDSGAVAGISAADVHASARARLRSRSSKP